MKKSSTKNATSFDALLELKYGKVGTPKRENFEKKAKLFVLKEFTRNA
ncbi:MAG: hypothetical protein ACK500_00310 [Flavobacteriales bacterium]|jgi:hypothetical protein